MCLAEEFLFELRVAGLLELLIEAAVQSFEVVELERTSLIDSVVVPDLAHKDSRVSSQTGIDHLVAEVILCAEQVDLKRLLASLAQVHTDLAAVHL